MRTIERINTIEGFRELQPAWARLLGDSSFHTIFQTFPWLFSWWQYLGGNHELYLLVIKEDAEVVGIAPLMRSPQREIRFIGVPNADYSDIIGSDKDRLWVDLLRYFQEHVPDWSRLTFDQLTERASSHDALRTALQAAGYRYRESIADICLGFEFEGNESERSTFEVPKTRGIKKVLRDLERLDGYTFRRLNPQEIQQHLPLFFHLHICRWDHTPTPSKFVQEMHRQFYADLVRRLAPQDQLYMTMMAADSVPVAYCLKFAYRNTMYHYSLVHNPYFSKWSPGIAFLARQTEQLIREGYRLDFSRGFQEYKNQMANRLFRNYRIDVFSSASRLWLHDLWNRVRWNRLVRRLWEHSAISAVRSKVTRLRRHHGNPVADLMRRAARLIFHHRVICVYSHEGEPVVVAPPSLPVEIKELTIAQLPLLATFYGVSRGSQKFRTLEQRFARGGECHGVFHNGILATVGWGLPYADKDRETGFVLMPRPKEIVVSDLLTMVPYRGLGLQSYLLQYQLALYHCRNQRALIAVEKQNAPMQRVIKKLRFVPERTTHIIKILSIHIA